MPTDAQAAGAVEEALLADPGALANLHGGLVIALQNGLVAHVHALGQVHVLGVEDQYAGLEHAALPAAREVAGLELAAAVALRG